MADPVTMAKIGTAVMGHMNEKKKENEEDEPKKSLGDKMRATAEPSLKAVEQIEGIKPAISWSQLLASYGLTR